MNHSSTSICAAKVLLIGAFTIGAISVEAQISGFGKNGVGWTLNRGNAGEGAAASISNNVLNIVKGGLVGNTAYYKTPQNIGSFAASFVWQNTEGGGGDGFTFIVQNQGLTATADNGGPSGGGSTLCYQGISPASGVAFNIYSAYTVGIGYAPLSTGNGSYRYQSTGSINLDSTDPISVGITYYDGVLGVNLLDLTTSDTYSTNFNVDLTADAGGTTAYVGFTGASGYATSDQIISDFYFTPLMIITTNSAFGFNNGHFGFDVVGPAGQTVVIQASTDLVNWTPLETNVLSQGLLYFSDPDASNFAHRFYQVVGM
jgi:hypothetical protein